MRFLCESLPNLDITIAGKIPSSSGLANQSEISYQPTPEEAQREGNHEEQRGVGLHRVESRIFIRDGGEDNADDNAKSYDKYLKSAREDIIEVYSSRHTTHKAQGKLHLDIEVLHEKLATIKKQSA